MVVGALLSLTLLSSLLLTGRVSGDSASVGFYVQQGVLFAISAIGTTLAVRRWRRARV